MSFKRLTANAAKRILDALHPRFIGRDQDHLLALADEATDDGYTQMQDYVQPLYDFRNTVLGTGYVVSFNGRSGSVVPASGDYTFAQIGSKPTTLGGYGITDAAPLSHVGSGGTAHANVVASGAAGFMTGADKAKLDGIASGATANTGTVTSVAVANATGITWTGSPITTSGTLTPTLSANLQAWSGLATSAKQDASANLTSWSGITPSTKADDSAVVHIAGTETITGVKNFTGAPLQYAGVEIGWRSMPVNTQNANYTLVVGDRSNLVMHTTATAHTYTVPANVFAAGDVVTITQTSATGNLTLAQGASMGLFLANSGAASGNRTVAPRGVATILFVSATAAIVGGPGVT